jgi:hypothetical protein
MRQVDGLAPIVLPSAVRPQEEFSDTIAASNGLLMEQPAAPPPFSLRCIRYGSEGISILLFYSFPLIAS